MHVVEVGYKANTRICYKSIIIDLPWANFDKLSMQCWTLLGRGRQSRSPWLRFSCKTRHTDKENRLCTSSPGLEWIVYFSSWVCSPLCHGSRASSCVQESSEFAPLCLQSRVQGSFEGVFCPRFFKASLCSACCLLLAMYWSLSRQRHHLYMQLEILPCIDGPLRWEGFAPAGNQHRLARPSPVRRHRGASRCPRQSTHLGSWTFWSNNGLSLHTAPLSPWMFPRQRLLSLAGSSAASGKKSSTETLLSLFKGRECLIEAQRKSTPLQFVYCFSSAWP